MEENHFDKSARTWDMNPIHLERTAAIANAILDKDILKPDMTGMEFGAGTGLLSIALKDHFSEIILIDSSVEMIRITKEKLEKASIRNLLPLFFDLEKSEYQDKTFDIIFSQMALHHVDDVDTMLRKLHMLLNPGGMIVIADLYSEDGDFHDQEFHGHLGFDPEELASRLSAIGYRNPVFEQCFTIHKKFEDGTEKDFPVFLLIANR